MIGEKSDDENSTMDSKVVHGPSLCSCEDAEQCPYWEQKLKEAGLSMSRGMSIGHGKHRNIIYMDSNDLDKIPVQ